MYKHSKNFNDIISGSIPIKNREETNKLPKGEISFSETIILKTEQYKSLRDMKNKIISNEDFHNLKSSFEIMYEHDEEKNIHSNLHEQFKAELKKYNLRLYRATYRERIPYNSNKEYLHRNLNTGFIDTFSDMKDYLFVCFRVDINILNDNCLYMSWWITNTHLNIEDLLETDAFLFNFSEVRNDDIENFVYEFKKREPGGVISEEYLK
uniref:Uncharacterized protein n=1 Tax=viral metagenome TaxID=1070528 RepID=A0A6C0BDP6_9ZZZZ